LVISQSSKYVHNECFLSDAHPCTTLLIMITY
jgi:hypothetical protein